MAWRRPAHHFFLPQVGLIVLMASLLLAGLAGFLLDRQRSELLTWGLAMEPTHDLRSNLPAPPPASVRKPFTPPN
jgi:hypothetical protein